MRRSFIVDEGESVPAALLRRPGGYALQIDGEALPIALTPLGGSAHRLEIGPRGLTMHIARQGDDIFVQLDGRSFTVRLVDPLVALFQAGSGGTADVAKAPMPGMVVDVLVRPGEPVSKGQPLIVIESMKLQTTISAWRDGAIETVHVSNGQSFDRSAPLVALAAVGE